MPNYVDGFVLPVPLAKLPVYRRLASMMKPGAMPFDGKRMFWGGFTTMVEL